MEREYEASRELAQLERASEPVNMGVNGHGPPPT